MSDLILPDRRLETMELFYPGRKPVGNVKIDRTNKYGKFVKNAWMFGSGRPKTLAGTNDAVISSGNSTRVITNKGAANYTDASAYYNCGNIGSLLDNFTVLLIASGVVLPGLNPAFFGCGGTNNAGWQYRLNKFNQNFNVLQAYGGSGEHLTTMPSLTEVKAYVLTKSGSTVIMGNESDIRTITGVTFGIPTGITEFYIAAGRRLGGNTDILESNILFCAVFEKSFDLSKIKKLTQNPYQTVMKV